MQKVAIIGKQQPLIMRKRMKDLLDKSGFPTDLLDMDTRNAADWTDKLEGYAAIISAGEKFPAVVFEKLAGSLKLLSRYGIGTDEIDKAAAAEHGIAVCNAAGTYSSTVAECAMGMILCLLRRLPDADREVRAGDWSRFYESKAGTQIEGKTVGLIGFGDIAKALAKMLSGFNCSVIAYDIFWNEKAAEELNVARATLEEIQKAADIISLHVPATPETKGMINKKFLEGMKKTAILINTARGELIVENDLADALKNGTIKAAALDVFSPEPPLPDNPLLKLPNVFLAPHCGAGTDEGLERAGLFAAQNVADFLSGKPLRTILNPNYINALK
ncbi:MAG: phosphoglycerate dehydrogenase [Oscillospiraceae bacterium]|nr:phosphoglycerate dehydrogenase [Oscillospiraceae bacterium]